MTKIRDYITAHAKALIALISLLIVQLAPSGELDWVVTAVGLVLLLIVPNDEAAAERIYPNRRRA